MVTLVLPDWMVWLITLMIVLQGANSVLELYLRYLKHKAERLMRELAEERGGHGA